MCGIIFFWKTIKYQKKCLKTLKLQVKFKKIMKKTIILLLIVGAIICKPLYAQKYVGGFGFFSGGVSAPFSNSVQTKLQSPQLFGNTFKFSSPGVHYGGKGFAVLGNTLIGGGGGGSYISGSSPVGEATLSYGAGFFNVGYLIHNKEKSKVFVLGGIGGGGGSFKIINTGITPMRLENNQEIPANENREVSTGGFGFEFVVGGHYRIIGKSTDEGNGGLLLGLIAGVNYFPTQTWKLNTTETAVSGLKSLSNFYVGVTFGMGGGSN